MFTTAHLSPAQFEPIQDFVQTRLEQFPCVAILGSRQVGKTTLAQAIVARRGAGAIYLDLENPADRRRLDNPRAFLDTQDGKLVVLDEIHRVPEIFTVLRGVIDDRRRAGQRAGHFLILGSAALDLLKQSSESLAGRIVYIEMPPFQPQDLPSPDPAWSAFGRCWGGVEVMPLLDAIAAIRT